MNERKRDGKNDRVWKERKGDVERKRKNGGREKVR